MRSYGLVLAGGGAKGAYQIGAWKALRELNVTFSAIAGVSIGSINGALIASDNFDGAMRLWHSVSIDKGVNITEELRDPNNLFSMRNFSALFKEFLKNGGIDASPTREFIGDYISEADVRKSPTKFGIVTFQISGMTPKEIFVEDIPQGQLLDYLLASSKVPGVSKIGPEGERFLDGGVYDNAPIGMLRRYGYNRLVIIDISSMKGVGHRESMSNTEMIYIRPHNIDEIGAAFDFDDEMIDFRIKMGYYDARKAFGLLSGRFFYFEADCYRELVEKYGAVASEQLECLAKELELPRFEVYRPDDFLLSLKYLYMRNELEQSSNTPEEEKFYAAWLHKLSIFKSDKDYAEAVAVLDNLII